MNQQTIMSEQDTMPQDGTNPELEVVEDTIEEETIETPVETEPEKTYTKEEFSQVLARAKKAEALLKQNVPAKQPINNNPLSEEQIEVKILKAQGVADNLIEELKIIAKARGKSILDTQSDPLYLLRKDQLDNEVKSQKAKLGASKGSGTVQVKKSFNTPEISDAEHKELWRNSRDQ